MSPFVHPLEPALASILLAWDDSRASEVADIIGRLYPVSTAISIDQLRTQLSSGTFDLLLVGPSFDSLDGLLLCRDVRAASAIPIIKLRAPGHVETTLDALDAGADHSILTEASATELLIHVGAVLRRSLLDQVRPGGRHLTFSGWRLDPLLRELHNPHGVLVSLSAAEFDLLLALCRRPGKVIARAELLAATHVGSAKPVERSVDVHVSRLRRKLTSSGDSRGLIKTVRLGGYVFTAKVENDGREHDISRRE
jgi:two-component system OmpR family response regulator